MKLKIFTWLSVTACTMFAMNAVAQQVVVDSSLLDRVTNLENQVTFSKHRESHLMVVGLLTVGFAANKTKDTYLGNTTISKTNSLADADHYEFSPMFLWRHGKKFLMEFEPSFAGDQLGVNWADVSYFAAPGLILRAGYLVIPYGFYSKHLAAGWIDKLATDPIGLADVPPTSDYGVEAEGGWQAGNMKFNYDVSLTNGMQLLPDGELQSTGIVDNNNNKLLTARLGWLPFSNSSLELGLSALTGKVGDQGTAYQKVAANMYAIDMNLVENIQPFQLNIKGQYNIMNLTHANYTDPNSNNSYSFTNHSTAGFIQAALRPSYSENNVVKNFEIAARYGNYTTPANSIWGAKSNALTFGLNYWLTWRTVIKFSYEAIKTTNTSDLNLGGTPGEINQSNTMYLQYSIEL
ncbi:MAG: hypothetical protein KGM98_03040 [Bacteroidota bacterium]|nr:hypothetical protein [Bacteroidota bacterium]